MSDTVTLRDTFAAAALSGLTRAIPEDSIYHYQAVALQAYGLADAMLRERARTHPESPGSCPASTPQAPRKSQSQIRLECWQQFGSGRWGLGVAIDFCDLDRRVAVLEKMIHDAAPAARASDGRERTDKSPARPVDGTGESDRSKPIECTPAPHATPGECTDRRECTEPVAWAVVRPDDAVTVVVFRRSDAGAHSTASDRVIPLYRQPRSTLTDAERESIRIVAAVFPSEKHAATLRGLLERTKGGGE